MLFKVHRRIEDEKGFTLIELLVVILIIAILAAVAIPVFLNQRGKAYDSNAESMAKSAQVAEETYATSNNAAYTTSAAALQAIDPSLNDTSAATLTVNTPPSGDEYQLVTTAINTGDKFTVTVSNAGVSSFTCTTGSGAGSPGACSGGTW
jgi:type IV pilus assembly protein PilA